MAPQVEPPQKHKAERHYTSPDPTPLWKILLEVGAIAIGFLLAYIYGSQLTVMKGQLKQMEGSSNQTDQMLCLVRQQVEKMTQQALDTHALAEAASKQVDKLDISAKETHRLAVAADTANTNALEADRPWIGATFAVKDFEANKTPVFTVTFFNTGKRPARVTLTRTLAAPIDYKGDPIYGAYDTTPSSSIMVPGQPDVASWTGDRDLITSPIKDDFMKSLNSESVPFRVYAEIKYSDVRTNVSYWTHGCWRYMPGFRQSITGFSIARTTTTPNNPPGAAWFDALPGVYRAGR